MTSRPAVATLILVLATACSTQHVVRLDTGVGEPLAYRPPTSNRSVKVGADAFEEALTRLALHEPLTLRPANPGWLVRASYPSHDEGGWWQRLMSKGYVGICKAGQRRADCLSLLDDAAGMTEWDKLGVALALSLDPLKESISKAVEDTLAPQLFYTVIASGLITWAALAANPEPVFTKSAAIVSAVLLICLGIETFLELVDASRELKRTTDKATTWEELEQAGRRFANRVGPEVARVFVLVVTVVVSHGMNGGAAWLASRLSMLPSFSELAAVGASRFGIILANVGQVSAVAVSADGTITITLAPTAVAMTAGAASTLLALEWHDHHIATDKWTKATHNGGPWTPRFQEIFDRAGMSLNDPENIVRIKGHKGPHPQEYHEEVFERLRRAIQGCGSIQTCQAALRSELRELAQELSREGAHLHELITRSE